MEIYAAYHGDYLLEAFSKKEDCIAYMNGYVENVLPKDFEEVKITSRGEATDGYFINCECLMETDDYKMLTALATIRMRRIYVYEKYSSWMTEED